MFRKLYIFVLFCSIFSALPYSAQAAVLSFSQLGNKYNLGSVFPVTVYVDSTGDVMNASSGVVSFPWDKLEVVSVSKTGSIFSLWAEEPTFSNKSGTVSFEGVVLNPGYSGSNGKLLTINFKAKSEGQANISFTSGSILANDGSGTNILDSMRVVVVNIVDTETTTVIPSLADDEDSGLGGGVVITSKTHADQTRWYSNNSPEFSWALPDDATEVRTLINKTPTGNPSVSYKPPISEKVIENLSDGVYYFHLQVRTGEGWSATSHYKVSIDTIAPEPFKIIFPHGNSGVAPQPVIFFNTKDKGSGISHYEVKIDGGGLEKRAPHTTSNPYPLPPQKPGKYVVKVVAIDQAYNSTEAMESFVIESIDVPIITYYQDKIDSGDLIRIRGTTYNNADITIIVREGDEVISKDYVRSNSSGEFSAILTKRLSSGKYTFTAFVTDERGAISNETKPLYITVKSKFFTDIISLSLDYLGKVVVALLVIVGLVLSGFYGYKKIIYKFKYIRVQGKEAEDVTSKSFALLKNDIKRHITRLNRAKKMRELTKEEVDFLEDFEKNLDEAHRLIIKEINDIDTDIS